MGKIKINFESYDGNFYKLELKNPSDPIVKHNRFQYPVAWSGDEIFGIVRVQEDSAATPILRAGKDSLKCPYCGKTECIIEGKILMQQDGNLKTSFTHVYGNTKKWKPFTRGIYQCTQPKAKPKSKLFLMEFVKHDLPDINVEDIVRKRHCLRCNARWDMLEFEVVVTKDIYREDGAQEIIIVVWCNVCGEIFDDSFPLENKQPIPRSKDEIFAWIK